MVDVMVPQGPGGARPTLTAVCHRLAIAILVAFTTAGESRAGIVIGPGGHVPFGGVSQWQAVGESVTVSGEIEPWNKSGTATAVNLIHHNNTTLTLNNIVGTTTGGGPATLSAAATITAPNLGSGRVSARGWSNAVINDVVMVVPSGGTFNFGLIEFVWKIDGVLQFDLNSTTGDWLNLRNGFKWAHYAKAQTYVTFQDPATQAIETVEQQLWRIGARRAQTTLTQDQEASFEYLRTDVDPNPQTVAADWFFVDGLTSFQDRQEIDSTGGYVKLVEAPWGSWVSVMLGLATFYNTVWDVNDFGGLDSGLYAQFENTAELTAVHLYNADGTPYTGQWTLLSQNGIDYPEATPVPEPGAWILLLTGLLCVPRLRRAVIG